MENQANPAEELMTMLEQSAAAVATCTGMKRQFIESGWSEHGAEQAVIAMMNSTNK